MTPFRFPFRWGPAVSSVVAVIAPPPSPPVSEPAPPLPGWGKITAPNFATDGGMASFCDSTWLHTP